MLAFRFRDNNPRTACKVGFSETSVIHSKLTHYHLLA
jgi:hypothetical protein